jgi:SAM-dependent methyltransferase
VSEPAEGLVRKTPGSRIRRWIRRLIVLASGMTAVVGVLTLAHFPWDVDQADTSTLSDSSRLFYEQAYALSSPKIDYGAAKVSQPTESPHYEPVSEFMRQYGLEETRVLEIGAGAGALQDVVDNYVGLDIAESARSNFHKPFVQGSATDLPFADGQFDVIWTLWTLEHVPNPEKALSEMRRVVTDGGYLYVAPMWDVPWWRPRGYDLLPYSELDLKGKVVRSTVAPVQQSLPYICLHRIPAHAVRSAWWYMTGAPTRLRYKKLEPLYERFLGPDSDAVNSLDAFEAALWFKSRGDECLNCVSGLHAVVRTWGHALIIRVHK